MLTCQQPSSPPCMISALVQMQPEDWAKILQVHREEAFRCGCCNLMAGGSAATRCALLGMLPQLLEMGQGCECAAPRLQILILDGAGGPAQGWLTGLPASFRCEKL